MNCKNTSLLRVVRGNAFKLKIAVEAYTTGGRKVESFSVDEAELKLYKNGTLTAKEYTILEGTTIMVEFDGSDALGVYGFQMEGTFEEEAWRWANWNVFQIVETNEKASIPDGFVVIDDTYNMAMKIVLSGGDGATFTPSVSEQCIISWTNDCGLPNPEPRNIRGPQGPEGPKGDTGVSITDFVKIGETETETFYHVIFSDGMIEEVTIPKGEQGPQGPQGEAGIDAPQNIVVVSDHTSIQNPDSNTIYRESGANSYTDWMYQDGQWKSLATFSFGIDEQPTFGSSNLVESGGVADFVANTELVSIPFDGGNKYIARDGTITSNSGWRITKPIPADEGDEFYYSGNPGTASLGVAAYKYENGTYSYIMTLVPYGNSMRNNVYIVIPEGKGITHVYAVTQPSVLSSSYFKTIERSALSKLTEDLGDTGSIKSITGYTSGNYVKTDGTWQTGSAVYKFVDVVAGDNIQIYDLELYSSNIAVISKKITSTSFVPLVTFDTEGTKYVDYVVQEDMTICICGSKIPRLTVVKSNKMRNIDVSIASLKAKQSATEQYQEWLDKYDLKLGYMFNNIAVIGDSMSVGSISTESSSAPDANMGASWLSILAKRWGCISRMHYAIGGSGCYSWLNDNLTYGLGVMLRDTHIYNCYLIAYGHNDSASVGAATDTTAPVTITDGVPACPSGYSFCAYYKAVIDQIRTKAPHAMIFCLSEYDDVVMTRSNGAYRQAIIDVANLYYEQGDHLVYHLETGGVSVSGMTLGTHYSTQGYFQIAKRVDQEANKVIFENRTDIQVKEFGIYNNVNARYAEYVTQ